MTFVDPDGNKVEFRVVNSTSGEIDIFENDEATPNGFMTKCTRNGATIKAANNAGDTYENTAPDEDTARRVIELFKKSRGEVRCVTLPWNAFAQ